MVKYQTIPGFARQSGYTEDAIRAKINRGDWLEGAIWRKAPDGRILIIIEGYHAWVEGQVCAPQRRRA